MIFCLFENPYGNANALPLQGLNESLRPVRMRKKETQHLDRGVGPLGIGVRALGVTA